MVATKGAPGRLAYLLPEPHTLLPYYIRAVVCVGFNLEARIPPLTSGSKRCPGKSGIPQGTCHWASTGPVQLRGRRS